MHTVSIRLKTTENKINAIRRFARSIGADVTVEKPTAESLSHLIAEAEKEFSQGEGVTLSLDELRALTK